MAKNVQIIPVSGSTNFYDSTAGTEIKLELSSSGALIFKSGSSEILNFGAYSGASPAIFRIANDKKFNLPNAGGIPAPPYTQGDIIFESGTDSIYFYDGSNWVGLIGPIGPQGNTGPDGPIGPIGPIGDLGLIGPKGQINNDILRRFPSANINILNGGRKNRKSKKQRKNRKSKKQQKNRKSKKQQKNRKSIRKH